MSRLFYFFSLFLLVFVGQLFAHEPAKLPKRTPWTTSRITGSPEKPLPYVTERAFPNLKFKDCLDNVTPEDFANGEDQ